MTVAEMKERKTQLGYTNEMISELSGVPLSTVQKIFAGVTEKPRYETLKAIESILNITPGGASRVGEEVFSYMAKKQGGYTVEDYFKIPDERRVELIDGVIYDMTAPFSVHQMIQGEIYFTISTFIKKNGGKCIAGIPPFDVLLNAGRPDENRTMVQPDVIVVCDRSKVTRARIEGAPDFVVEILSPSTKKKDAFIKLHKYEDAGVREYWMVDPDKKKIITYVFDGKEDEIYPTIYGFGDKVPVAIFDNKCEVDFAEIYNGIKFLYEEDK